VSLAHALLGLVNYQPTTGYELKATFTRSIHFFWNATLPQIYRTLNQMKKKGWLTMTVEPQVGKPSRNVYHITKAGREEFRCWLGEPLGIPEPRNAMLIKVFFGNQMEPSRFVAQLREWRQYHAHLLERYEKDIPSVITKYANATRALTDASYWTLTLDYGKRIDRMIIEWCDEVLKRIGNKGKKERPQKKPVSPPKERMIEKEMGKNLTPSQS
jgi:DNA-binding PadR family transcriptional regulator